MKNHCKSLQIIANHCKSLSLILFASILLLACQKTQNEVKPIPSQESLFLTANTANSTQSNTVQVVNERLVFSDTSVFLQTIHNLSEMTDAQIDAWENNLKFKSYVRSYKSQYELTELNSEFEFKDQYFARILNNQKVVQIGQWIFKINAFTEKVYAMHQNNISDLPNLESETLVAGSVVVFPTSVDVYEILTSAMPPPSNGDPIVIDPRITDQLALFCMQRRAEPDISTESPMYTGQDGAVRRFDGRLEYYKYGVYFSLLFSGEHLKRGWTGFWAREETLMDYGFVQQYVKRCDGGVIANSQAIDWSGNSAVMRSYKFQRCYESVKALREYFLEAAFIYREAGGSNTFRSCELTKALRKHIESY